MEPDTGSAGHAASGLTIGRLSTLEEFQSLRLEWDDLLERLPHATSFNTWEWLSSWWNAFQRGRRLLGFTFRDARGVLVGFAPLAVSVRSPGWFPTLRALTFLGDGSADSESLDVLVLPGFEPAVVAGLLDHLGSEPREWDIAELNTMQEESPVAAELLRQLQQRGWTHAQFFHPRCVIPVPESWEAFLRQVSRKERDNIRYYERRLLRRAKVSFRKSSSEAELASDLTALYQLHQKRWVRRGEPGSFSSAERIALYERVSREFLRRNWLEFWLLEIDSQPAAAQFSFRFKDTVYALQQGFDEQYAALCIQDVLRAQVIRELIREGGVRFYDLLGGISDRKRRWSPQERRYTHLHFALPLSIGSAYLQTVWSASRSKQWIQETMPESWLLKYRQMRKRIAGRAEAAAEDGEDSQVANITEPKPNDQ